MIVTAAGTVNMVRVVMIMAVVIVAAARTVHMEMRCEQRTSPRADRHGRGPHQALFDPVIFLGHAELYRRDSRRGPEYKKNRRAQRYVIMSANKKMREILKTVRLLAALPLILSAGANAARAGNSVSVPGASASGLYLTASVTSHHFGERSNGRDFNEFNPGLGLEWVHPSFGSAGPVDFRMSWIGGAYYNSINRLSVYAGGGPEGCYGLHNQFSACAGIAAGAVTGYRVTVAPAVLGTLKLEHNPSGVFAKLGVIPEYSDVTPTVLTLQFGYKLPW